MNTDVTRDAAGWIDAAIEAARRAIWLPGLVFVTHVVATRVFHVYDVYPDLDIPMHLLGGFAIAFFIEASIATFMRRGLIPDPGRVTRSVLLFALVVTATVFWEFSEYLSDRYLGTRAQPGLEDTLLDMLLGTVGGLIFMAVLAARRSR